MSGQERAYDANFSILLIKSLSLAIEIFVYIFCLQFLSYIIIVILVLIDIVKPRSD